MNTSRPLNHKQRLALIHAPMPPVRICYSQKRWAGVFVNDNFGENALRERRRFGSNLYDRDGYETWEDYVNATD